MFPHALDTLMASHCLEHNVPCLLLLRPPHLQEMGLSFRLQGWLQEAVTLVATRMYAYGLKSILMHMMTGMCRIDTLGPG